MPRKEQGWITFQSSAEERQILEQVCQQTQRTKTEILRELIRQMGQSSSIHREDSSIAFEDTETDPIAFSNIAPQAVQISARNVLQGRVKKVIKGSVNAEVTVEIAPGVELVSIVTRASADRLALATGKTVFAVIKSSSVMIAAK